MTLEHHDANHKRVFWGCFIALIAKAIESLPETQQKEAAEMVKTTQDQSKQKALGKMAIFPAIMLVCYLGLLLFFKSKGGYKPVDLTASE